MHTISTRISDNLNMDLIKIAKFQERSKSYIVKKALQKYLIEAMEDAEDIAAAEEALTSIEAGEKTISWERVQKNCGLLDN